MANQIPSEITEAGTALSTEALSIAGVDEIDIGSDAEGESVIRILVATPIISMQCIELRGCE